jgi:hypothetical protein
MPILVLACVHLSVSVGIQYISSDAFLGRSTDVKITEQCVFSACVKGWLKWQPF